MEDKATHPAPRAVPDWLVAHWQATANAVANIFDVPSGLIMRLLPRHLEVLVAAEREGNPFAPRDQACLDTGLYCETVMATRAPLLVPNALEDEQWKDNPDVALNMIAYLGVPLIWPDEQMFGVMCVLDTKTRDFPPRYVELLMEIKRGIERDFQLVMQQQSLEEKNRELSQTLESLTQAQAELVVSAKNAALGAMVAGVAHELGTPIGNSVLVASTLNHKISEFANKVDQGVSRGDFKEFVKAVRDGSDLLTGNLGRAAQLVASFKRVAVDQGTMVMSSFNLRDLVNASMASSSLARGRYHAVSNMVSPDIEMSSYLAAVSEVLTELLENAARHAFTDGRQGLVTVFAETDAEGQVQIGVRDDGVGIAPADQERVFDPFFTTQLGQGGSGLGLHLAHNMVKTALRGRISVESSSGEGACFRVTLPLIAAAA
ncbi:MAG TPA: GAF domain-containing sensor histidine kinase [Burkholderiaceae bacterium]|jgi:signal transduction histidine kinase